MRAAVGKYILILTADVTVLEGSIAKMVDFMEKNSQTGLAGPKIINPDGSYQITCRTFQTPKTILYRRTPLGHLAFAKKELDQHLMSDFNRQSNREVDWVMGACMIIRKSAMDKVGLFDERFFFYVEDMDWCRRFWVNGYKVNFIADAVVIHLYEKASDPGIWNFWKLDKMARWHMFSGIKYFFKYLGEKKYERTQ
jgi:GT2 family glycosyltransferase